MNTSQCQIIFPRSVQVVRNISDDIYLVNAFARILRMRCRAKRVELRGIQSAVVGYGVVPSGYRSPVWSIALCGLSEERCLKEKIAEQVAAGPSLLIEVTCSKEREDYWRDFFLQWRLAR